MINCFFYNFQQLTELTMENHKFILNEYASTILNNRIHMNQNLIQNYTLCSKMPYHRICISIYLEHDTDHRKILAEQWILSFEKEFINDCSKLCCHEIQPLCCMLLQSPLYQNFIIKQGQHKNYYLQTTIDHNVKNQNLELYKCYHLNIKELNIIARFHQHLNLSNEFPKQRSSSFQQIKAPRIMRFNSEQIKTPEKPKVFMYSFDEDVTFLIDEHQVESVMSQDSDYFIQTIDEETDVSDWQVIDVQLSTKQKKLLNSLKEIRNNFNQKHRHSHQINKTLKEMSQ